MADPALLWGDAARRFAASGAADAAERAAEQFRLPVRRCIPCSILRVYWPEARAAGVRQDRSRPMPRLARSPMRWRALRRSWRKKASLSCQVRRRWDEGLWPHATRGFFAFNAEIEGQLRADGLI